MSSLQLDKAKALRADIEAGAGAAEAQRRVDAQLIDKLNTAGLFAMNIPAAYGGAQLPALASLQVLEELAYADSAVGWCGMIYSTTAVLGSFLPEQWGHAVYGSMKAGDGFVRSPLSAGAAAPSGKGKAVDGGVVVSGRWAWGSGSHHCDWICGGTTVQEGDDVRRFDNGEAKVHVMFFERDQVELKDNWDPSGLRGTGSVDFEVHEQFVPEGRWTVLGESKRQVDDPLYRFPFFGYFAAAVACVPLGIARRALDDFDDLSRGKIPAATTSTINHSAIVQLDFAQAEALVEAAHHYLYGAVERVWDKVAKQQRPSTEDRRQLRLAASQATRMSAQAVDMLYNAAGGSALQGHCSLQKHFRDIHAATQHRMVGSEAMRMAAAARITDDAVSYQL